ncbi:hypothetical protein [Clostridium sp. KNHs214]|uniref:hypothetical protein n=1 Tax=Clostridium sp. KNHs214 TaxID=1540257 RepID=UPI00055625A3|nr:hypothetical protein [Clostridium sp. KNHs214]
MKGVKLDEIKLNIKYKNLKEICEVTGIEYKDSTNSRKKIIKELERYMKLKKDGRGYIITEIYSTPKEKIDGRKTGRTGLNPNSHGNNTEGIYGKYIDSILIDYFQNCIKTNKYVIWETTNMLAERTGMVNWNYRCCNSNKWIFKQLINQENNIKMTNTAFYNVFSKINELKRKPIIVSLDRLQKQKLIKYEMNYIIYYNYENRIPRIGEDKIIEECVKMANEKFGIESVKEINFKEKLKNEYYTYINELTTKKIEDCEGVYTGFKIIIKEKILDVEKIDNVKELKKEFNGIIINKVKEKMFKNKKKIQEEYTFLGKPNPFWKPYILNTLNVSYLAYTDVVIDYILNLDKPNITNKIEKMKNEYEKYKHKKKEQKQKNQEGAEWLLQNGIVKLEDIDVPY